jgi:signal transduction histidine kinase
MASAVTAALEQQRRLVADTSHQMRNPMAALRLRVDALHMHLPASADRTYTGVTTELDRLETLLDDLLALAAAEHRAGELAVADDGDAHCDAAGLALTQVQLWEPVAHRAGVRLVARAGGPVPAACTDRELAQVVDILLDNALKYAGADATVTVGCAVEDGTYAVLTVTDDGPGLDAAELARATERFWRAGRHPGTSGTGLGLAIAEQLLAGRAGRLELRPARPRGLRARAVLPLAAGGESRSPEGAP